MRALALTALMGLVAIPTTSRAIESNEKKPSLLSGKQVSGSHGPGQTRSTLTQPRWFVLNTRSLPLGVQETACTFHVTKDAKTKKKHSHEPGHSVVPHIPTSVTVTTWQLDPTTWPIPPTASQKVNASAPPVEVHIQVKRGHELLTIKQLLGASAPFTVKGKAEHPLNSPGKTLSLLVPETAEVSAMGREATSTPRQTPPPAEMVKLVKAIAKHPEYAALGPLAKLFAGLE